MVHHHQRLPGPAHPPTSRSGPPLPTRPHVPERIGAHPNRPAFTRARWVSVLVVLVSFPLLPSAFGFVRVIRLLRLFRLLVVVWFAIEELRVVLGRRGLVAVATIT